MKRFFVPLLIFLNAYFTFAQPYTVDSVPNTKLINNSYVSNPDKLLTEQTVIEINQALDSLEKKTSAEVAVVMLSSIGEADIFDFAQSLFTKWGIGKSSNDNGLLILYVQDIRTVRFHPGYGLEGALPDAVCKRIQMQKMVPLFKEGNIDAGMKAGVEEVVNMLTNPAHAEEIKETEKKSEFSDQASISFLLITAWLVIGLIIFLFKRKSGFSNSRNFPSGTPHSKMSSGQWLLWYYFLPIVLLIALTYTHNWTVYLSGLYVYIAWLGLNKYYRTVNESDAWLAKKEYQATHHFLRNQKAGILTMAIFFPLPFIFIYMLLRKRINSIRTKPRDCKNCGQKTIRLDEVAEDEYLSKASRFEETLKSIDYDVWKCNSCGEISLEAYINDKTKYSECPKCNTRAFYTSGSRTKLAATTRNTGKREIEKSCKYCNHRQVSIETIPVIEASSSHSGSSSSSRSSGGSFGGGRSGGGGASSSW